MAEMLIWDFVGLFTRASEHAPEHIHKFTARYFGCLGFPLVALYQ